MLLIVAIKLNLNALSETVTRFDCVHASGAQIDGALAPIADHDNQLLPEERRPRRSTAQRISNKRANEFSTGRLLAHTLLAQHGYAGTPVPASPDRMPVWPADILGSISHSRALAAVALCKHASTDITGLGIDIERANAVKAKLAPKILTAADAGRLSSDETLASLERTLVFSAKEAIFKAIYPQTQRWFYFLDVDLQLEGDSFAARVSNGCEPELARRIGPLLEAGTGALTRLTETSMLDETAVPAHVLTLFAVASP